MHLRSPDNFFGDIGNYKVFCLVHIFVLAKHLQPLCGCACIYHAVSLVWAFAM